MKTKYFLLLWPCLLLLFACSKGLEVDSPSFSVSGYTVNEVVDSAGNPVKQVVFNIEGNADVISFFSGEILHEYAHKDGRILPTDALNMSFDYFAGMGAGTNPDWKQLSVKASSNFNGSLTTEGVEGAVWTDITDRFSLPMAKDVDVRTSTSADISDLAVDGQPLYIAFRYVTPPRTVSAAYTTWDVFEFTVSQETALGSTPLVSQREGAFPLYYFGPNDADTPGRADRTVSTTARLRFRANILAANLPLEAGVWAISAPLVVGADADLGPDRPVSIKNRIDPVLSAYTYNYTKPGTYKVTFVASNVTTAEEAKVVKELDVIIP